MLVLSRKPEETIQIGETVRVTILSIDGNRVKIGLDAPESVPIRRGELKHSCEQNKVGPEVAAS